MSESLHRLRQSKHDVVSFLPIFLPPLSLSTMITVLTTNRIPSDISLGIVPQSAPPASSEFNSDFSCWLPGFHKPARPCDYCHSRGLDCFFSNANPSGPTECSPCQNLFRPCSFINSEKAPALKQRTALDTLDVVAENDLRLFGGLTGRKQMRSLGHRGPIEVDGQGQEGSKIGAAAARFPREAVKILKDWMLLHIDNPYPTEEEKDFLKKQTGLSIGQISNWMANTRRRQKARPKRSASPSIRPSTQPINIPQGQTWESMSTYTNLEFTRSHKTLVSATTGRFLTFRVRDRNSDAERKDNWQIGSKNQMPAHQQENCFG